MDISVLQVGHCRITFGLPLPAPKVRLLAALRRAHSEVSTASGMLAGSMESDHWRIYHTTGYWRRMVSL